jgi:hypothetical protein
MISRLNTHTKVVAFTAALPILMPYALVHVFIVEGVKAAWQEASSFSTIPEVIARAWRKLK